MMRPMKLIPRKDRALACKQGKDTNFLLYQKVVVRLKDGSVTTEPAVHLHIENTALPGLLSCLAKPS